MGALLINQNRDTTGMGDTAVQEEGQRGQIVS